MLPLAAGRSVFEAPGVLSAAPCCSVQQWTPRGCHHLLFSSTSRGSLQRNASQDSTMVYSLLYRRTPGWISPDSNIGLARSGSLSAQPKGDSLRCLHAVNIGIFGNYLDPDYGNLLFYFERSFVNLVENFNLRMTTKAHILIHHVPRYIEYLDFP